MTKSKLLRMQRLLKTSQYIISYLLKELESRILKSNSFIPCFFFAHFFEFWIRAISNNHYRLFYEYEEKQVQAFMKTQNDSAPKFIISFGFIGLFIQFMKDFEVRNNKANINLLLVKALKKVVIFGVLFTWIQSLKIPTQMNMIGELEICKKCF